MLGAGLSCKSSSDNIQAEEINTIISPSFARIIKPPLSKALQTLQDNVFSGPVLTVKVSTVTQQVK